MIESRIDYLRRKKALDEGRDISLRTMAKEAGLSLNTVQRLVKGDVERVYMSTLDAVCKYFNVSSVAEVIVYVAGGPTVATDGHETPAG